MKLTSERLLIIVLFGLLVWFGTTIVRLENYHYGAALRMCDSEMDLVKRGHCLNAQTTRNHWGWNLLYGLRVMRGVE